VLTNLILIIVGLAGLFFGGDWLVTGASRLARSFGISALIVGLTVVAFGTSAPELLVSVQAVLEGSGDLSVGNIIGSNISNIGLILGLTSLIFPVFVQAQLIRREIPIMIFASLVTVFFVSDGVIQRTDGIALLGMFVAFNLYMGYLTLQERHEHQEEIEAGVEQEPDPDLIPPEQRLREVGRLVLGLIVLVIGARLTITGATAVAREIGVSELVIGVSLVAVGTSLPELATAMVASFRKENDIALGNIVGSNIFNLLLILGITATTKPLTIPDRVLGFDIVVMMFFSLALLPLAMTDRKISRTEATIMFSLYIAFIVFVFIL